MRRLDLRCLLLLAAVAALTSTAHATVRAPVELVRAEDETPAAAGAKLALTLRLRALGPVELSSFRILGEGWSELTLEAPERVKLQPGEVLPLRLSGRPTDPKQPVVISFVTPHGRESRGIDLSGEPERLAQATGVVEYPDDPLAPGPAAGRALARPEPSTAKLNRLDVETGAEDSGGTPTLASPITVHGRFIYLRSGSTTVGADGVTVRVYQSFIGPDLLIGSGVTDAFGYYSFTANPVSGTPDLYATFTAANGVVRATTLGNVEFTWGTAVFWNFAGSDLNLGSLGPTDASKHPPLHHLTTLTRAWRWINVHNGGEQLPQVTVMWAVSSSVAFFSAPRIYMNTGSQWDEDTLVHEYGHFWQFVHNVDLGFGYCNGICDDDPPDDCGHCTWCEESSHVAWNEGWSDWLSDVVTRDFQALYGQWVFSPGNYETIFPCGTGGYADPEVTEGDFAALLRDLEDTTNEDDFPSDPWRDQLDLDPSWIFTTSRYDDVQGPRDFLLKFHARYPVSKESYWETAYNAGYDLDLMAPDPPANFHSTSHTPGGSSTDPTIDLAWTRANDDWSGPGQYDIQVGVSINDIAYGETVGDVTSWSSMSLPPGTWYFWISTRDRANHGGVMSAALGPFTILPSTPANLVWYTPLGWPRPAVPRPAPDAVVNGVGNPSFLTGNAASTWANLAGRNSGTQSTGSPFVYRAQVDGSYGGTGFVSTTLAGGGVVTGYNGGPITVRGGRHTFAVRMDDLDAIAESSESDNAWAHPWVWSPLTVGPNAVNSRSTPPRKDGGWPWVLDGSPLYYNSDGLRMNTVNGWWSVFWVSANNRMDDYDLRLHFATSSPDTGFGSWQASSARVEGFLDAVIVNRNVVTTPTTWDVGVINWRGASNYTGGQAVSTTISVGDSIPLTMPSNAYVIVREFYVPNQLSALHRVRVEHDPVSGPLVFVVLRPDFTVGGILDYDEYGETDAATGTGAIDFYPNTGWHAVVIYRDPKESTGQAVPFGLEVELTPQNPAVHWASGWTFPVVPRPDDLGEYNFTDEPAYLAGDGDTWGNWAFREFGPVPLSSHVPGELRVDGTTLETWDIYGWAPFAIWRINDAGPYTIRGGRHTFTARVDPQDQVEETYEDDNFAGQQWIWTPVVLGPGPALTRGSPPDPVGGWSDVTNPGAGLRFNCDGVRTAPFFESPNGDGRWGAATILPSGGDADLRLHEVATSVHQGFDDVLAYSGWIRDLTDYVLIDFNRTPFRDFDTGIQYVSGTPAVTVEVERSKNLGLPVDHWYGPFTLGAGSLLHLYEVRIDPGVWAVDLHPEGGTADLGLAIHKPFGEYQTKSTPEDSALSFLNPFWSVETTRVAVVHPSEEHAITVWKAGSADLPLSGTYRLHVFRLSQPTTAVEALPTETAIAFVAPNPARAGSRIGFDLARNGPVTLELIDVRGARVRTVANGSWPAGHHERPWDGRDGAGHAVPPGMYFLRLEAAGTTRVTKLVVAR